ncbi:MAG: hypothetical protein NVSMB13_21030 [Mycobacteriales bacterium]
MRLAPEARRLRSQIAKATQLDRPDVDDLRREFKTVEVENYIRQLVDNAPPLTDEQRDRLVVLLRGSAA